MIDVLGLDSRRGLGIFLFTTTSRMALGPTQPPIQWVTGALYVGAKLSGHEANHSPPSCAEEKKNDWRYTSTPQYAFMAWCSVKKHRGNFIFTFTFYSVRKLLDTPSYSSSHSLTSALYGSEWSASRPGRFIPRKRAPGTNWIGDWRGT
jgi:hypothetical protein